MTTLKGVGDSLAQRLAKLGVETRAAATTQALEILMRDQLIRVAA